MFNAPVTIGPVLPASCSLTPEVSQAVTCNFSKANGTPTLLPISVTVGFARSVTAQAFVFSDAAETAPDDNHSAATIQVRPRPFSRNGLPVIIP